MLTVTIKKFLVFLIGFICFHSYGQFTIGVGAETAFLNTKLNYNYGLANYNDNETFTYYLVRNQLKTVSPNVSVRSFGRQFLSNADNTVGYSLEIGYQLFTVQSKLFYQNSSTANTDSIINLFDHFSFTTNYHLIRMNHFFDWHINPPNTNLKITHSLGVGFAAIVKYKSRKTTINVPVVNVNHPIINIKYQPQITEKYGDFAIMYFASISLFSIDLFTKPKLYQTPENNLPLSALKFNSIGIRIFFYKTDY